jgi:hypothetical protein
MVTPTFAAGLGIVIAAGLAAPVAGNVLHYNAAPDRGRPCPATGCRNLTHGGAGLATARPGVRVRTPAGQQDGRDQPSGSAAGGTASQVRVRFRTMRGGGSDWVGEMTLAGPPGRPLPRWTLRFSYPSDQIVSVWRDGWVPHGRHSVTVSGAGHRGGGPEQRSGDITFVAVGRSGRPAHCTLNGQPCRFG